MSEQEQQEHLENNVETNEEQGQIAQQGGDAAGLSDFEREQQELGWDPNGRYGAEEWSRNYSLTKTIKTLSRENKELKKSMDYVKGMFERQEQREKDKEMQELRNIKHEAIKSGNVDLVEQIEEQQYKQPQAIPPEMQDFNSRYADILQPKNKEQIKMKMHLLQVDAALGRNLPLKEHLALVEESMHETFPEYFGKTQENLTPEVESGINSNVKKSLKKKHTYNDLNPEQRRMFDSFKRHNFPITLEDYINDLKQQGQLK